VNTINENSVINAVNLVKKQRDKKLVNEVPICITKEFAELLDSFTSISQN
jgi:hypothetical protein